MKCIVHIGPHKTGSTAIQKMLSSERAVLARRNIEYPQVGFSYYGHHELCAAMERDDGSLEEMITSIRNTSSIIVLSSENFSRSTRAGIMRLAKMLKDDDVRIIFYLRSTVELIYAWWQELTKHGSTRPFLRHYADIMSFPYHSHLFNVSQVLSHWAAEFGREVIQIYRYDEITNTADHFARDVLGVDDVSTTTTNLGVNRSFDVASTELIRRLNEFGLAGVLLVQSDAEVQELRREMRARADTHIETIVIGYDCFIFRHNEREIVKNWGSCIRGFSGDGPLFAIRTKIISYIDSKFWANNPDLSYEITKYAVSRAEERLPESGGRPGR